MDILKQLGLTDEVIREKWREACEQQRQEDEDLAQWKAGHEFEQFEAAYGLTRRRPVA